MSIEEYIKQRENIPFSSSMTNREKNHFEASVVYQRKRYELGRFNSEEEMLEAIETKKRQLVEGE